MNLKIEKVEMIRPLNDGPDEVCVHVVNESGEKFAFSRLVARGNAPTNGGDEFVRKLGVKSYLRSEPKLVPRPGKSPAIEGVGFAEVKL